MNFISVVLALAWLILIPVIAGSGIVIAGKTFGKTGLFSPGKLIFSWLMGQLLLWCAFQFIATYHIIKEHSYKIIEQQFVIVTAAVCVISLIITVINLIKNKKAQAVDSAEKTEPLTTGSKILWGIVILGIIIQIILQIVLTYMEVDDSVYVSTATSAIGTDKLYYTIAYTGVVDTYFDIRHGLAPFPIWLAVISHTAHMKVASMAHVMIPAVFLPLTYAVYALFGSILLGEKKKHLPIFMIFTELLVTFGFYSYMTPEKFFITRLREGKASLASLILPGIIMCLFMILKNLKEDKKTDFRLYILLLVLNGAGCLCSTLGALLCVVPIGICAIFAAFMFKKFRHLPPMVITCLPCIVYALLYLKLG